jgi:tetratricopeptide (TPR) repeat protein
LEERIKALELTDRWAVVIGISKYKDNTLNLQYAESDAQSFFDSLIKKCRFKKEQIKLLINENATYENIRKSMEGWLLRRTNKDDKIIIFFSGHGYRDTDNNNDEPDGLDEFLVPFDFQSDDISSAIRDDIFAYWINELKAENIILFFDSCFSGGAAKAKGIINKNVKGDIKGDSFVKDIFGEVPREGISLLSSSKADQLSFESPEFKMGLFTYYLIDSMNKESDSNLDNKITIKEMFDNLSIKTLKYSKANFNREQEPVLIDTMKNPFDLVYMPVEISASGLKNNKKIENLLKMVELNINEIRKIELLEEVCKLDPENIDARSKLALYLLIERNYDRAIYHYEASISLIIKNKDIIYYLPLFYQHISEAYEGKGNFEEAKRYIKEAIELKKEKYEYFNQLANLFYKNNEIDEAIRSYLTSIKLNEIQDDAYFNLAKIYIRLMKYNEAKNILNKAIDINPDYSKCYYLKSLIYKYLDKDINKSNEFLKKFYELNPSLKNELEIINIRKERFEINQSYENFKYLISYLEDVIEENDFFAEAYIDLIQTCRRQKKDIEKAENYYKKLIEIYPFLEKEKELFY